MYRSMLIPNDLNIFIPGTAIDITDVNNPKMFLNASIEPIPLKMLVRRNEEGFRKGPTLLFSCNGFSSVHFHLKNTKSDSTSRCTIYKSFINSSGTAREIGSGTMFTIDPISILDRDYRFSSSGVYDATYFYMVFSTSDDVDYQSIFLNDESYLLLQ